MKKSLPEEYKDPQPTVLEISESSRIVSAILDLAETEDYEPLEIAGALVELIGRLSDRYAGLESASAARAFSWVTKNMDLVDQELADACLTVLMNTENPQEAHDFIAAKLSENPTCPTAELMQEFCDEISSDYNLRS